MSLERTIRGVLTEQIAPKEITEAKDPNEYDKEGEMMKSQLRQIDSAIDKLMGMVKDDDNLPEWVQSKMTKATDYIRSVRDYLESEKMDDDEEEMDEAYSPMHVKQAIGIASDKRYKGGNMTGAVAAIEKLKKGLSNHPQVKAVLRRVNEEWVCGKCNCDPCTCENNLEEKTLTPAELKKREEIAKAIERENPDMPMPQKMAIATAQAKKVAEATVNTADIEKHKNISQSDKDKIAKIADMMRKEREAQAKKTTEAYDEPQGQAKRMMSPLQKARMDKEKADRDRDGKLKPGVTKEEAELEEAKKVTSMQIHKVLAKTKNSREGIAALKKAFRVNDMEAKKMLNQVMNEETIDEISRSMTPMSKRFGKAVDPKKFDAYKKHVKQHGVDEPTVRFIDDNPGHNQSKRAMQNKHVAQAVKLYKAAHKEDVNESAEAAIQRHTQGVQNARDDMSRAKGHNDMVKAMNKLQFHQKALKKAHQATQTESTFVSKFKEELKEKKRAMKETKAAPKGYHFTKDGKLKKGDADVDGPGGEKLRADPLDKQRSKIPPLPEKNIVRGGAWGNPMPKPAPRPFPGTKKPPTFGF